MFYTYGFKQKGAYWYLIIYNYLLLPQKKEKRW
jgi:hypothetical protein